MASGFPGFSKEAMQFFRGLERNNTREWFLPRKALFEEHVKAPMHRLVDTVNGALRTFAPDYVTDPAKAVYRFYRDVRFSKDKSPYKTQIAASFYHRTLAGHGGAGYYFAVNHKVSAIGGGIYMPPPESLLAVRNHIAEHHADFRRIVKTAAIRRLFGDIDGEQLTRVPKGFCSEHPAADLLRYKQFLLYIELPGDLAGTAELYPAIVQRFRAIAPFLNFLNAPLAKQGKKRMDPREMLI